MNEEKKKNEIPVGLLWSMTVLVWLLAIIWTLDVAGNESLVFSSIIFYCCQALCIAVFIIDIFKADIFNKPAWIIMIVLLSLISFPIYLIQRKRLIRIQARKVNLTGNNEKQNADI